MVSIYSGKEKCLERYLQLMRSDEVTISMGSARRELKNTPVESALEITTDLPLLFDRIYQLFPKYYNLEGSYGKIGAIKSLKKQKGRISDSFLWRQCRRPRSRRLYLSFDLQSEGPHGCQPRKRHRILGSRPLVLR